MKTLYDIESFLKRDGEDGAALYIHYGKRKFYVKYRGEHGESAHLDDALENLAEEFRRKDAALKSMRALKEAKAKVTANANWPVNVHITAGAGGASAGGIVGGYPYPICTTCGTYPTSLYGTMNPHEYEFFCSQKHSWRVPNAVRGSRITLNNGDSYEYNGYTWVRVP